MEKIKELEELMDKAIQKLEEIKTDFKRENNAKVFEQVTKPLMKHLDKNYHPHHIVIVESDKSIIYEGLQSV